MDIFVTIGLIVNTIVTIGGFVGLVLKPFREAKKSRSKEREAIKCLLRSQILETYERHKLDKAIGHYEYESVTYMYTAYKNLGGNSFIDLIWDEMSHWSIQR